MSRDRHIRRRHLLREHEALEERAARLPEATPPSGFLSRAKQKAHQKLRRALQSLMNALPHRADEPSTWLTTTTDEALAVSSRARGNAHVDVHRNHFQPSWDPLRERLNRKSEDGVQEDRLMPPKDA